MAHGDPALVDVLLVHQVDAGFGRAGRLRHRSDPGPGRLPGAQRGVELAQHLVPLEVPGHRHHEVGGVGELLVERHQVRLAEPFDRRLGGQAVDPVVVAVDQTTPLAALDVGRLVVAPLEVRDQVLLGLGEAFGLEARLAAARP